MLLISSYLHISISMQTIDDNTFQMEQPFPDEENMTDAEFAFWDEFYREKNEDGTLLKIQLSLQKIKTN